jgi:hypothetical protein
MVLDLSKLPVTDPTVVQLPPEMARGVDLAMVRDRRLHQHHWVTLARYAIDDEQAKFVMEQIDRANGAAARAAAAGEPPSGDIRIDIPLAPSHQMGLEGPGCMKCGVHIANPVEGYGKLCKVADPRPEPGIVDAQVDETEVVDEGAVDDTERSLNEDDTER